VLVDLLRGRWSSSEELPPMVLKFLFLLYFNKSSEELENMPAHECKMFTKMLCAYLKIKDAEMPPNLMA